MELENFLLKEIEGIGNYNKLENELNRDGQMRVIVWPTTPSIINKYKEVREC